MESLNSEEAEKKVLHEEPREKNIEKDEVIIMCSVPEVQKVFVKEYLFIWIDQNSISHKFPLVRQKLVSDYDAQIYSTSYKALNEISRSTATCHLVISASDVVAKSHEFWNVSNLGSIFLFDERVDPAHIKFSDLNEKVKCLDNDIHIFMKNIQQVMDTWQREESSFRLNLPAFSPIFNDYDKSMINNLHYYLTGFTHFKNRKQARKDFLSLAKCFYTCNNEFKKFEEEYHDYDMEKIFFWYTKDHFLYKMTNNSLRAATSDSIQYSRLTLKDLELAIREQFNLKSKNFGGLLYRGAFISEKEWESLKQNINREIEMHGFLSTSKTSRVALNFAQKDLKKTALLTILTPQDLLYEEQGLAEIKEYSHFQAEDEVLFNIRSRFTILQASIVKIQEKDCRHLVLFYGKEALEREMEKMKPELEITVDLQKFTDCIQCKNQIEDLQNRSFYIDISKPNELICSQECLSLNSKASREPLVYIDKLEQQGMSLKLQGKVLQYSNQDKTMLYGYKCGKCEESKQKYFYKCITCQEKERIYCENCVKKRTECQESNHILIVERRPLSFWYKKMSQEDIIYRDYKAQEKENLEDFQQAETFVKVHQPQKAIDYYDKCLSDNTDYSETKRHDLYYNLAQAHYSKGEYSKALKYHLESLGIRERVLGNHPKLASSYNKLGLLFDLLGDYPKALQNHLKSIQIKVDLYGNDHPSLALSYANLSKVYGRLGDYVTAFEYSVKSLELNKSIYGHYHVRTAASYSEMAALYSQLGHYSTAIEYYERNLGINKAAFGDFHPAIAISCDNLGKEFMNFEVWTKSEEYYLKALHIREKVYGEEHPETAISHTNLSLFYKMRGNYKEANDFASQSTKINNKLFGAQHLRTITSFSSFAKVTGKTILDNFMIECVKQEHIRKGDLSSEAIMNVFDFTPNLKEDFIKYQKAIGWQWDCLSTLKSIFGENHFSVAASYADLAEMYEDIWDHTNAIDCYGNQLQILELIFGNRHFEVAKCCSNLSLVLQAQKNYQKALEYEEKALEIKELLVVQNHSQICASLNKLASLSQRLEDYPKVLEYNLKHLEVTQALYGDIFQDENEKPYNSIQKREDSLKDFDSEAQRLRDTLANLYEALGDNRKALQYRLESLQMALTLSHSLERYLGERFLAIGDHNRALKSMEKCLNPIRGLVETSVSSNILGRLYFTLKDYEKALHFHLESCENYEHMGVIGRDNTSYAISYNNLGEVYQALGDYIKAKDNYIKSVEIFMRDSSSPQIVIPLSNLGEVYDILGDQEKALETHLKHLNIYKFCLDNNNSNKIYNGKSEGYGKMIGIYMELKDHKKVFEHCLKITANIQAGAENDKAYLFCCFSDLGSFYEKNYNYTKALEYFTKALQINGLLYGYTHPFLVTYYEKIGSINQALGNYSEALQNYLTCLEIAALTSLVPGTEILKIYNSLIITYEALEDYKKALEYQLQSLEISKLIYGESHPDLITSYTNIGEKYQTLENYEKVLESHFEALKIGQLVFKEDYPYMATSYSKIGKIYDLLGDQQKAVDFYMKAVKICKSFRLVLPLFTLESDLGRLYHALGNLGEAKTYYLKSLDSYEKVKHRIKDDDSRLEKRTIYGRLGEVFNALGDQKQGEEYYFKSLGKTKPIHENKQSVAAPKLFGDLFKNHSNNRPQFDFGLVDKLLYGSK